MSFSPEKANNDIGDVNLIIPNRIHACTSIWLIVMLNFGKYMFDGSEGIFYTYSYYLVVLENMLSSFVMVNFVPCRIPFIFLTGHVSGESPKKVSHISSHGTFPVRQMENLEALATMKGQKIDLKP